MTATVTAEALAVQPAKGRKRLVAIIAAVVLLAAGAAGGFLLLGGPAEGQEVAGDGAIVHVAEMTANLGGERVAFAKLSFSAVLAEGVDPAAVAERFPIVTDVAITELSTLTPEHLRTTAGMDELRSRLSARAGEIYPDGEVRRFVLTELVVQ
jgi:flagellar protein FliL